MEDADGHGNARGQQEAVMSLIREADQGDQNVKIDHVQAGSLEKDTEAEQAKPRARRNVTDMEKLESRDDSPPSGGM
ncbi:hypothetical protein GCK32_007596 [Trichostrongylus colubriformis]|uniref:Uncharacterized protein n=1 Tax=Trichostrongylus colubriformis TaxID=6319 RepID=A0AAN8FHA7_TRICO